MEVVDKNKRTGGTFGSQYDLSGRLLVSNPGAEHEMTYGYDNNGNLTSINVPSTPWYNRVNETPTTYTYYPGTNRLYQAITATETKTYLYDNNGNTTGIGNKILAYNQNNRLVSVTQGGTTLGEYTYNGLGQRIIKAAGGVSTVFHYDFDGNIIGESDTSGVFSKEYLYRESNRLVLVDVGTGALYYYGNDQLGTPHILTDSTNTVVWEAVYAPYGEADINPNSTVVNNFRFSGQYFDAETGLHYNYFRYYNPGTGRYLTPDPIGLVGGINLFFYVQNNPINKIDSFGLEEGSPANRSKRKVIDKIAKGYDESIAWAWDTKKDNFPAESNKCNKFVYDVIKESNALSGYKGQWPPLAGTWAHCESDIPEWRCLSSDEAPQPGDVAAYPISPPAPCASGHTGIIISTEKGGTSNISAHYDSVYSTDGQFKKEPGLVYRRYTGE